MIGTNNWQIKQVFDKEETTAEVSIFIWKQAQQHVQEQTLVIFFDKKNLEQEHLGSIFRINKTQTTIVVIFVFKQVIIWSKLINNK